MRSIPFKKLPNGYIEKTRTNNYIFFTNEKDKRIFWKRVDKELFMFNKSLSKIPIEEKHMFWYDSSYLEINNSQFKY